MQKIKLSFVKIVSALTIVIGSLASMATNANADTTPDPMLAVTHALAQGNNALAESLCSKELQRLKALGSRDNKLAAAETQMAAFMLERKRGAEAEPLALDALNIYAKTHGKKSHAN